MAIELLELAEDGRIDSPERDDLKGDVRTFTVEQSVYQAAGTAQASDSTEMKSTFTIVSSDLNRHGNQLQLGKNKKGKGVQLQQYRRNPIVMYEHGFDPTRSTKPIGLSEKGGKLGVRGSSERIDADVWFRQGDPFAVDIFGMVSDKTIRMASIGFAPILGLRLRPEDEQSSRPGDDDVVNFQSGYGWFFTEWELREWSIVTLGADFNALRQAAYGARTQGGHRMESPDLIRELRELVGPLKTFVAFGQEFMQRQAAPTPPAAPAAAPPIVTPAAVPENNEVRPTIPGPPPVTVVQGIDLKVIGEAAAAANKPLLDAINQLQKDVAFMSGKVDI